MSKEDRIYLRPTPFQLSFLEKHREKRGTPIATIVSEILTMVIKGELVLKETGLNYFGDNSPNKSWI